MSKQEKKRIDFSGFGRTMLSLRASLVAWKADRFAPMMESAKMNIAGLRAKAQAGDWKKLMEHQDGVEWQRQPWLKWAAVGATTVVLASGLTVMAITGFAGGTGGVDSATVAQQIPDEVTRKACQIVVDGKPAFIVGSRQEAEKLIQDTVNFFSYGQCGEGMEVAEYKIKQQVTYEDVDVTGDKVLSSEQAKKLLNSGKDEKVRYVVQPGDTLWSVATKNGMSWNALRQANAQLVNDNKLKIGQEIYLNRPTYYLSVVSTFKITAQENIPYSTKVEKSADMRPGAVKVKMEGQNGQKIATYVVIKENNFQLDNDLVSEKVLRQPVQRVEVRGDRVQLASRGGSSKSYAAYSGGGSGQLSWPCSARRISSPFGYRGGREFHPAIDIDLNTGDPVSAAADGVVVAAGWAGNYGKRIIIDHGGIQTMYCHLSQINVGEGQTVSRGSNIGLGGATGRATGSHLHFEVHDGGVRNPLGYLN